MRWRTRSRRLRVAVLVAVVVPSCLVAVPGASVPAARAASPAPVAIAPPARYVPVGPERLADTREPECGCTRVGTGTVRVQVTGRAGVPTGATAVAVTVTVVNATTDTYLTAWPAGTTRPTTSTVNARRGVAVANAAIVPLSVDGAIDLFSPAEADVVVDVSGAFVPAGSSAAGRFVPAAPMRLLDTRETGELVLAGGEITVARPSSVAADALALVVNVTSVGARRPGFVTARAAGAPPAVTSVVNPDGTGSAVAAAVVVPVSPAGVTIGTSVASDLVFDLVGWFTGPSAPVSDAGLFVAAAPQRLVDTRDYGPRVWADGTREVAVDLPGAAALVTNVTLDLADAAGFVTAHAAGTARPPTSTVNARGRATVVANAAITGLSDRGLAWYANAGTDLVVDVSGWFTGSRVPATLPPSPNTPPTPPHVLLVGDSTLAALDVVTASQRALQGMVPDLDAAPCRRLVRPSCRSAFTGLVPTTAVEAIRIAPGPIDVVVLKAGYNEGSGAFASYAETVLAAARARGARVVVWLTFSEGTGTQLRTYALNNAVLRSLAASGAWPELQVADWRSYASANGAWYSPDRVHLQGSGAWATADYVSRWVAHVTHRSCPQPWAPGESVSSRCPDPDAEAARRGPPDLRALYPI
jgi:hypothetical protein